MRCYVSTVQVGVLLLIAVWFVWLCSHKISNYTISKSHRKPPIWAKQQQRWFVYSNSSRRRRRAGDETEEQNRMNCTGTTVRAFALWIHCCITKLQSNRRRLKKKSLHITDAASMAAQTKRRFMVFAVLNHRHERSILRWRRDVNGMESSRQTQLLLV